MKQLVFITAILLLSAIQLVAQSIKVDAEIRSRAEYRAGFREPLADTLNPAFVNNLRTKLNVSYASQNIKAKVSLLDARTFGSTETTETGNSLGILEAWGEYNFTPEFSFSLGRQALNYDDGRLFSYADWVNTPPAHDILLVKYNAEKWNIHLGSAYNNAGDVLYQGITPYAVSYKTLNFIRAEKNFGLLSASALWINDSHQSGTENNVTTTYRNTTGGNLWLTNKQNPFTFLLTGYYQFGRDKTNKKLNAYLLSLKANQQLNEKYSLQIGSDLFSGSAYNIENGKSNTFNKLYGTNHTFNGSAEYWTALPAQGLIDVFAGATAKFSKKINLNLVYHYFSTQKKIDANGTKSIGSEIDITANYTVNEQFTLQGGWSAYFANKGTDILKNKTGIDTRFPQWAYIQLTFKPEFLNKK